MKLWLHGLEERAGRIKAVSQYSIFLERDGIEEEVAKLQIKAFCSLQESYPISWSEQLRTVCSPIERIEERFRISSKRLYTLVYHQNPVKLTLLEGLVLEGSLFFAGRYECGLRMESGQEIIAMRHAFHSLTIL